MSPLSLNVFFVYGVLGNWERPVADEGVGRCMDPEGNGVNPGEGNGGGPGPPSGKQDKQLISSRGIDNTLRGLPGRLEDEPGVTTRTHHAQST
jgi:hypothetical protein